MKSSGARTELNELLRENPVFATSEIAVLDGLCEGAQLCSFEAGAVFITADTPATFVDVLVSGAVRIFQSTEDGRQITVKHLRPPVTMGEMEVLCGSDLLESAQAIKPVTIVRLQAARFRAFVDSDLRAARRLLGDVCARFCVAARNERSIFFETGPRLAGLLLSYADIFGEQSPQGQKIRVPLSQPVLADGLGVVVRSVARVLARWKRAGVVSSHKGWLVIHDAEALEKEAGGVRFHLNYHYDHRPGG